VQLAINTWLIPITQFREEVMIKNKIAESEISALMLEINAKLNESVRGVQETCDDDDFRAYRRAVGEIMGEILFEIAKRGELR